MHKDRGSEGRLFALLRSCLITRKTSFTAIVIQQKKLLLYSANFIWEDDFLMEIHLWIWIVLWILMSKWRLLGSLVQHCKSVHFIHGYNIHHISLHLVVGHFRNIFFKPLDPIYPIQSMEFTFMIYVTDIRYYPYLSCCFRYQNSRIPNLRRMLMLTITACTQGRTF